MSNDGLFIDAAGFYGDTFSNGFGEFETMKRDASYLVWNAHEIFCSELMSTFSTLSNRTKMIFENS